MGGISACKERSYDGFACWIGNVAAIVTFLQNIPQIILNLKRKSVKGFSSLSVIIRIFGTSFLMINEIIKKTSFSILLSAILLLIEYVIYIIQFIMYTSNKYYILSFLIPIPCICLSCFWKASITVTQYFPAICSILNYIPFVATVLQAHTTIGISMISQILNYSSGIFGLLQCSIECGCDTISWLFFVISIIQGVIIFIIAMAFGEYRLIDVVHPQYIFDSENNEDNLASID